MITEEYAFRMVSCRRLKRAKNSGRTGFRPFRHPPQRPPIFRAQAFCSSGATTRVSNLPRPVLGCTSAYPNSARDKSLRTKSKRGKFRIWFGHLLLSIAFNLLNFNDLTISAKRVLLLLLLNLLKKGMLLLLLLLPHVPSFKIKSRKQHEDLRSAILCAPPPATWGTAQQQIEL